MNRVGLTLAFLLTFVAVPFGAFAQQSKMDQGHHPEKMAEGCKAFREKHDKFAADLKAMDARLEEKVAAMNSAKGDQKVAAMAAVISEMAAQRKEIFDNFSAMHQERMACMKGQGSTTDTQGNKT